MKYIEGKSQYIVLILTVIIVVVGALYIRTQNNKEDIIETEAYADNKYDSDQLVQDTLKKLEDETDKSDIIQGGKSFDESIMLTFEGLTEFETTVEITNLLNNYGYSGTFFVEGIKSAENQETVLSIIKSGNEIGNYTLTDKKQLQDKSQEEVVTDIQLTNIILQDISGKKPELIKCRSTKYNDYIRNITYACGLTHIVDSDNLINYQSFTSYEKTKEYINALNSGSLISIRLEGVLDESEYAEASEEYVEDRYEVDKLLSEDDLKHDDEQQDIVEIVGWVLKAIDERGYSANSVESYEEYVSEDFYFDYEELRNKNDSEKARVQNHLFTSQPAVAYVFRNVNDKQEVDFVLDALDEIGAKGSFFVTGDEIVNNSGNIKNILKRGHDVYNGGNNTLGNNISKHNFESICHDINVGQEKINTFAGDLGYKLDEYYMPLAGNTSDNVLEAASTVGYDIVSMYNINPIKEKYIDYTAQEIMQDYFKNSISLMRGDIVHFELGYFKDNKVVSELVVDIAENLIYPANYEVETLSSLNNSPLIYTPKTREETEGYNTVKISHNYSEEVLDELIYEKFIGTPVHSSKYPEGFTNKELRKVNISGRIDTNGDKVIFLTFDDWGSDIAVGKILDVLDKYNAKATFFVRTGYASSTYDDCMANPNLLRAIADAGHDVGGHTVTHVTMSSVETNEQAYRKELVACYQELSRYIEDTGRLQPIFRPTKLDVNKKGLQVVFDTGYEYIINGDIVTSDYKMSSAKELIFKLQYGDEYSKTKSGSVVIMHMSDNSIYTAEALDSAIPYFLNRGYRFAGLSEYLDIENQTGGDES